MADLYHEDLGSKSNPPLLYLHGGPGAGSYDFTFHQEKLLTDRIRLISLDQRGVLRSEPIPEGTSLRFEDLIRDIEALREQLDIQKWSVLGHSFGGYLGLSYAIKFPDHVDKLIFENAAFDLDSSARSLLKRAALEYGASGDHSRAEDCLNVAFSAGTDTTWIWEQFTTLTNGLNSRRNNMYFHGVPPDYFDNLVAKSPLSEELWARGNIHQRKLYEEGAIFSSLLEKTEELPEKDTLLIRGIYDSVMSDDQIYQYMKTRPSTRLSVFKNSSHFPHMEEPEEFALQIKKFVLADRIQ